MKPNDIIVANSLAEETTNLTEGKSYKAIRVDKKIGCVYVLNDQGIQQGYFFERFHTTEPKTALLTPQAKTVLAHLKRAGSITQREALVDHSIQSLTRRITELRDAGHSIERQDKRHPVTNQRYARYALAKV